MRQQLWWREGGQHVMDGEDASIRGRPECDTHSMACTTVTSFGWPSAEAVCQCSLQASHASVNKDYDHIMQMTVPSVHSSLTLACTGSLCSDSYLSPPGNREFDCAAMC